jgi:signal transduction histidine kinase
VQDGHVWVEVRDSGSGLAAEEQARLFTRFYRAGRTRRSTDGTGLGLVITRLLVEAHGGRITVDSAPSRGSIFSFSLPIASTAARG